MHFVVAVAAVDSDVNVVVVVVDGWAGGNQMQDVTFAVAAECSVLSDVKWMKVGVAVGGVETVHDLEEGSDLLELVKNEDHLLVKTRLH